MTLSQWMKTLAVGLSLMGSVPGCSDSGGTNVGVATSREIRGRVPVRPGVSRILRIVAVNAKTRRAVSQAVPGADGRFVLTGVTTGATYRLHAVIGRRSVPVTFPKMRGGSEKTNLFKVGDKNAPVAMTTGPIDVGELQGSGTDAFETLPERAPNLQEDYDADGMPDGLDPDQDGDGTPNAMDMDNDGDGMTDTVAFGDQDGDGLTNESDPDQDGDGTLDVMDTDDDNDGTPDTMDMTPEGTVGGPPGDGDGDGLPDAEDETPHGEDHPVETPSDAGTKEDAGADVSEPEDGGTDAGEPEDGGEGPDA